MATDTPTPEIRRVQNDDVWRLTRVLFLGSAVLFLINIGFGFDNALTTGSIPRWQVLIHLHAGSVGWITLSLIGLAIWVFTDQRTVSSGYVRGIRWLVWLCVVGFAAYIVSFGVAFSMGGNLFSLLPGFGTAAMLLIWAAALFAITQLRHQPVVTNVHLLVAGGLLVAAVGATMGVLLGSEYVFGQFLPLPPGDRVGVHAGMMDTYVLLVASAIIEWFVLRDGAGRWTWPGVGQALAGTAAAIIVPIGFLGNLLDVLLPVFAVLLLVFLVLFLVRMGWRAVRVNPLVTGPATWGFFGTIWLVVFVALFVWAVVGTGGDFSTLPFWFPVAFTHSAFIGMMTNLLFGLLSTRTRAQRDRLAWGEPAALWLTNGGLVVFIGLKIAMDSRLGALLMGLGVLLGVGTMLHRLWEARVPTDGSPDPT